MAESLHCPPETITTLLVGYTPIQNKNFKKKKEKKRYAYILAPGTYECDFTWEKHLLRCGFILIFGKSNTVM